MPPSPYFLFRHYLDRNTWRFSSWLLSGLLIITKLVGESFPSLSPKCLWLGTYQICDFTDSTKWGGLTKKNLIEHYSNSRGGRGMLPARWLPPLTIDWLPVMWPHPSTTQQWEVRGYWAPSANWRHGGGGPVTIHPQNACPGPCCLWNQGAAPTC